MRRSGRSGFRLTLGGVSRPFVRAGREEGSSLFEFAVVLPVLSMLLVGIVYGGITFYDYVVLANAVAVGARALAAGQGNTTVCADANAALTDAAYGLNASQITVADPAFTAPGFTGPGSSSCPVTQNGATTGGLVPGESATVTATYPCNLTIPFAQINLCPVTGGTAGCPSPYCISSTTTVRIE